MGTPDITEKDELTYTTEEGVFLEKFKGVGNVERTLNREEFMSRTE